MQNLSRSAIDSVILSGDYQLIDRYLNLYGLDCIDHEGRTLLMNAVFEEKFEVVRHLLSQGCDVNCADPHGLTALHLAAINGDADMAELLIYNGAHVDAKDDSGNTPLWRAAMNNELGSDIVKVLMAFGPGTCNE
ncbi:ankyrin repeat domain-containing protein [Pseudomonas chlororaphis]|uniref:Ankyrin repeat protein n=1 Tax=Pseudomonas chlororaphis O6 TaxID=1037915 RepID=A0AB33X0P0_9PSED|nr:ankyrin repeat domain-containing protein [Pseudomonas chlororaphis]EIM18888.1 ankyrin repeat protein [Pseudomonas chlororaphis O6]